MNGKLRVAAVVAALVVLAGLVLLIVRPGLDPARVRPLPLIAGAWMVFLAAAWLLRRMPRRTAVALILLGGIAVQLAAVSAPPKQSSDLYRYVWDGRVQAAGIDPYQYVPTATPLTGLRNDFLFNPEAKYCASPGYVDRHPAAELTAGCTRINRPTVPTIYPPVAEAYFLGVHYLPDGSDSSTPIQATTALAAILVTVLLLFALGRLGRDVKMAALWSWCPTVALEAGNSAHVDVIAVGIAAVAILVLATARTRTRTALGGVLLGLAIATKMTPALIVPAVLRRRWVTVAVSAGSAFVVVYIPHLLRVGAKVVGFLPGYLQQENYASGTRYGIVGLFVTGPLASVVAVLILAAIALAVLEFADPGRPWQGAVYMTAGALAVTTPHYQWYSLLLVMLVALDGRPEWLAFAAGGYYAAEADMGRFTPPWRLVNAIAYGVPLVVVAIGWLVRRELAQRAMARTAASAAGTVPLAGVPAESAAAESVPVESVPAGLVPAGLVPAGLVPAGLVPAESVLAGSAPAGSLPRRPMPAATTPAGAAPGATGPTGTVPGAAVPAGTVPAGFASAGSAADVGREVPV
ncbi:MAG TPA: glycosyltransferase family 87 protein [Streptosporangiaceae bacterium]|nr:glycosyltransferase family 87 protein [Streptosporangiaceae bacterium]